MRAFSVAELPELGAALTILQADSRCSEAGKMLLVSCSSRVICVAVHSLRATAAATRPAPSAAGKRPVRGGVKRAVPVSALGMCERLPACLPCSPRYPVPPNLGPETAEEAEEGEGGPVASLRE